MGNVDCDRAISGCCMLGGGTEQVVVGDVYGNLRIQRPHTPFPAVRTGHKRLRGVFSEYTCFFGPSGSSATLAHPGMVGL